MFIQGFPEKGGGLDVPGDVDRVPGGPALERLRSPKFVRGVLAPREQRRLDVFKTAMGGVGGKQEWLLEWKELTANLAHLRAASMLRLPVVRVEPRIPLLEEVVHPYWGTATGHVSS